MAAAPWLPRGAQGASGRIWGSETSRLFQAGARHPGGARGGAPSRFQERALEGSSSSGRAGPRSPEVPARGRGRTGTPPRPWEGGGSPAAPPGSLLHHHTACMLC